MNTEINKKENPSQEDEIDLIQLILTLWNHKYWIAGGTTFVTIIGVIYALLASPVYHAEATIAMKESDKGGGASSMLSQLGGMGGMVASQLGLGGSSLDKVEVILKGRELAERVIEKNNLLPILFYKVWDSQTESWDVDDSLDIPTLRKGIESLRKNNISVSVNVKKKMITVGANVHDSTFSKRLVDYYLKELNDKILADVKKDATINRIYLEKQLNNTSDPTLQEKISSMIAFEIEKYMLVSSQAFEVLEKAVVPMKRAKPKRALILLLSLVLGAIVSILVVFLKEFIVKSKESLKGGG